MTRPLCALTAIVRDEALTIGAMLDSCEAAIDLAVILDTGSTDGTKSIVGAWPKLRTHTGSTMDGVEIILTHPRRALFEEPFIPYAPLADRNLIDFAATRNRVLELATTGDNPPVFTLMLSGDETLHGAESLRAYLEEHRDETQGGYAIEMRSGTGRWYYTRILRTAAKWRYVFPRHELPVDETGNAHGPVIPGCWIEHKATDPVRRFARMRDGDLPILAHIADDPDALPDWTRRAVVYLAQTEEAIAESYTRDIGGPWGPHQFAAMGHYKRRVAMDGDPDEVNYAAWHYLNVAQTLGLFNDWEMVARLEPLAKTDPNRPEIWYMLAKHAAELDMRRGLQLAIMAADVAKAAKVTPLHLPTDERIEWLAMVIACGCAHETGRDREYVAGLAKRGLAAGGPSEAFEGFTEETK